MPLALIANTIGTLTYILLFSDMGIEETFAAAYQEGHTGTLLALGAILNLIAFFGFLRLKRDYRGTGSDDGHYFNRHDHPVF